MSRPTTIPLDPFGALPWDLLLRLLETRYDLVCEYIADEEDGASPYTFREDADALIEQVRACARWAPVAPRMRWILAGLMLNARRMWERDGCDHEEVRAYLTHRVAPKHLDWVLKEVYRDAPATAPASVAERTEPRMDARPAVNPAPLPA